MKRKRAGPAGSRAAAFDDGAFQRGMGTEQQRAEQGERMARDKLARDPGDVGALHLLGATLLAQGRARDAIAPLEQAARASQDAVVETRLALALRATGRTAEAIDCLQRATAREPPFAHAFHELGIMLCMARRYDEAEVVLKRGVALAPDLAELSVELGGIYISRADPANAKLAFARALTLSPGHPRALHGFGTAFLFEGAFERAAERFRQVLAQNPEHVRARLDLAHCLLELGRGDDAVAALRATVQRDPALYGKALKMLVSSGRGRFWLRPSAAAKVLQAGAPAAAMNEPVAS